LNLNGVILLIAIGALPALPSLSSRYLFLAIVVGLIIGFKAFHDRINRVRIFPKKDRKDARSLDMPALISATAATAIMTLAGFLASFFSADGLSRLASWISRVISE
jgi:hypothetical protein